MKDCLGNEINVGDKVVYVHKFSRSGTELKIGTIFKIKKLFGVDTVKFSDDCWESGVQSKNIMKLEK